MSRLQWLKKKTRRDLPTIHTTSSTHGSGAMDVGWLASGPMTCRQSQLRDGDKSKLWDKGVLKAVLNIVDVIAHELLGMDVWEQAEIDRTMVETLDGAKNDRCWYRANSSANAALAISMTVSRAGAAENEVFPHISTLTSKPTDKFMMPVSSFKRDQWWKSCGKCLACPGS